MIYIYRKTTDRTDIVPDLPIEDLLLPPIGTNELAWTKGYFKTLANHTILPKDTLLTHCFRDARGWYFDEYGSRLPGPVPPVGIFALHSYKTLSEAISQELSR